MKKRYREIGSVKIPYFEMRKKGLRNFLIWKNMQMHIVSTKAQKETFLRASYHKYDCFYKDLVSNAQKNRKKALK